MSLTRDTSLSIYSNITNISLVHFLSLSLPLCLFHTCLCPGRTKEPGFLISLPRKTEFFYRETYTYLSLTFNFLCNSGKIRPTSWVCLGIERYTLLSVSANVDQLVQLRTCILPTITLGQTFHFYMISVDTVRKQKEENLWIYIVNLTLCFYPCYEPVTTLNDCCQMAFYTRTLYISLCIEFKNEASAKPLASVGVAGLPLFSHSSVLYGTR